MTTNRVDFYQSEQNDLTIAAGEVRVFVEGRMQPALAAKKIVRAGRPEFGWARIALIETPDQTTDTGVDYATPHNGGATRHDVDVVSQRVGKRIKIVRYLKSKARPEVVRSVCIFAGQIERIDREIGKSGEVLEFFARDFSCQMENVTVYGRYAVGADGSVIFLPGLDTIFN